MKMRETSRDTDKKPYDKNDLTWANQIRLLTLNFQQLSATLGQGLIAAILPAIQALNALMGKLIQAAESFRNFIYTLVGKKVEGSQKGVVDSFSSGLGDYSTGLEDIGSAGDTAASGLDDATGSAEELKKALSVLPFDELNQLVDNTAAAGSGSAGGSAGGAGGIGGSGIDFGDLGASLDDLAKVDVTPINKWARRIRNAFLDHDWDRLGKEIAWGINKGLQKLYDVISWRNVGPKITAFTDAFTQTFNSLVDHIDWNLLGRTVGTGLNTIVNTLDGFVKGIDWINLGSRFSDGINGFVKEVNWTNLGNLIGEGFMISWDIFQGLVTGLNYEEIGHAIENGLSGVVNAISFDDIAFTLGTGLNGVVTTAVTVAKDFDFSGLGTRLSGGLNTFFQTFDFADVGTAINKWVNGILDVIIAFIDGTNWGKIGDEIGSFLDEIDFIQIGVKIAKAIWKAINAGFEMYEGMFEAAPLETALLSLVGITKVLKSNNIKNFVKSIKNGVVYAVDFAKALGGNNNALQNLQKKTPKVSKAVSTLSDAFKAFKTSATNGNWMKGIGSALDTIRNSMTKTQKVTVTAVSAFGEFSILKDTFKDLITGSGNLAVNIAELATTTAASAASMVASLGKKGLLVTAVTGLISLFSGIGEAINQIETERFGENVRKALTEPGGVSLDEIVTQYSGLMQKISDGFSIISEESGNLETANKNIESTQLEIQRVETAMDNGVLSVEEGTEKLTELFGTLSTVAEEKFRAIETILISAFGEGGSLETAYNNMGINTKDIVQSTLRVNDQAMDRIEEITKELATLDPSNPKYYELQQEMYNLMGTTDDLKNTLQNYQNFVDSSNIDYSNLVAQDGSLNDEYLRNFLESIVETTQNAQTDTSTAIGEIKNTLQEGLNQAVAIDDQEAIETFKTALVGIDESLKNSNENIATQAQTLTDTLQKDMIGNISDIIQQAQEDWNNMEPLDPTKLLYTSGGLGVEAYVKDKVNEYKDNIIEPISNKIEESMGELGINGAGWSSEASQQIIEGLFSTDTIPTTAGGILIVELNDKWKEIINGATSGIDKLIENKGKDTVEGFNRGIDNNAETTIGPVQSWQEQINTAIHNSIMEYGSPSKKAESYGKDTILGFNGGITKNAKTSKIPINNWLESIGKMFSIHIKNFIELFENFAASLYTIGQNAAQYFSNGFQSIYIPTPHLNIAGWNNQSIGNGESMSIPQFSVNWYKAGGLFTRATIAGIGEAGNEAVLPLENRRTMSMIANSILDSASPNMGLSKNEMRQAVAEGVAMAMMNNSQNQQPINVYAELKTENDEVLARAVTRGQKKIEYRMNPVKRL